jgi:hypothetical protein
MICSTSTGPKSLAILTIAIGRIYRLNISISKVYQNFFGKNGVKGYIAEKEIFCLKHAPLYMGIKKAAYCPVFQF